MQSRKLKIGLFLDSFLVPAWTYSALQYVLNGKSSEFKLIILNDDYGRNTYTNRNKWLYSIFNQIDEKIFTKEPDPFKLRDCRELMGEVPVINASPIHLDNSCILKEADARKIQGYELDILIKFGFENLRLESINLSKYGTWFYVHSDPRQRKGGPAGFWEVVERWPETGSALLAVGGESFSTRVLYQSNFFTYPLSPARHRSYYFWATTPFLQRQIEFLYRYGVEKFLSNTKKFNALPYREIENAAVPSNLITAISIAKIITRLIHEALKRIFYFDQWFLLFSFKRDGKGGFGTYDRLMPSKDKFWADPHVIQIQEKYYIFIEEFSLSKNKGYIAVIEMDESGNWKAPVPVLERDYHLSYPFIFNWLGKYYMIPESAEHRTIDLYECVEFPYKWRFKQNLMNNIKAVDTTMLYYGGKWWLFTAIAENEAAAPHFELFLFYADSPFTDNWIAHPLNPVASDVKNARPAGDVFIRDGKLFRPSQDCSKTYGYGFDLNEIVILSDTEYLERKIKSVRPDGRTKIFATHTYAKQENLTVIDALARRYKWAI
jgi:hypothetical protein